MDKYIDLIIKEAKKAIIDDEVPVGCIIVKNDQIISKAHNTKNKTNDVTNHAELISIRKASQKLNNWRLSGCSMYVTLFPCPMCISAIRQARIRNLYYIQDNSNEEYQKIGFSIAKIQDINPELNVIKIDNSEYIKLIKKFYSKKR